MDVLRSPEETVTDGTDKPGGERMGAGGRIQVDRWTGRQLGAVCLTDTESEEARGYAQKFSPPRPNKSIHMNKMG